ncbi:cytochrome b/b6 domain-containing protein [Thalassococcus sp. CAU 1522]|uniref:Cytochrome b/b6 domain-containing protein n=1 Tax=Thalassococcus arenae TaxID=2851652 RepID=A0ABS6NCS5_9RHOB|nr:cytochrome b/b6 domain-containing protein [Thalassococcus arenae]MBV2361365.1 cytochrome b/b6 domain-containing protein [Thalassococcus arenae]
MALTNTAKRYGSVAKVFHWTIAFGILAAIPLGILANGAPFDTPEALARKAWLFSVHKTLGVTIFFVALARIGWALSQPKPAPLHPERRLETLLAEVVHWLLYGSLVLVPATGWMHHAATEGFAPIWWPFGQNLAFVPESKAWAETTAALHIVFERVLVVAVLLHVAGAVKHAIIDRDETLARMLPGRTEAGSDTRGGHLIAPIAAVAVWAGALGIGAGLGVFEHEASAAQVAALEAVDSDWQVESGTLTITVQQLGSAVSGQFADWTADITFDESAGTGTVTVEVAIASLTLGSVTSQAMGPDYFDAGQFPTARFEADIAPSETGFVAAGSLRIRGTDLPVTLPFEMTVVDGKADMQGQVTLDRRAFGIGDTMTDASQLGFDVIVDVAVTAARAEN